MKIDYCEVLMRFLSKMGQGSFTIERMSGSSDSSVFLVGGKKIYRVGSKTDINDSMNAYARFSESLSYYSMMFPWVELLVNGDISIMCMEYIGEFTLEKIILQMEKTQKEVSELFRFNREILERLKIIYLETCLSQDSSENSLQNRLFLKELIEALSINLERAGLKKEGILFLSKLKRDLNNPANQAISSLAHKDFSVGNVIISDKNRLVKFIDPRNSIPYLTKSNAIGNVAVDIYGYLVSIERKEMEIQREYPSASMELIKEEINKEAMRYINDGVFSSVISKACRALWYSVYTACRCEYCISPDRVWLYNCMVQRLKTFLIE